MGAGAPFSSVQQRGPQMGGVQQAGQSIINARNPRGGIGKLKVKVCNRVAMDLMKLDPMARKISYSY